MCSDKKDDSDVVTFHAIILALTWRDTQVDETSPRNEQVTQQAKGSPKAVAFELASSLLEISGLISPSTKWGW